MLNDSLCLLSDMLKMSTNIITTLYLCVNAVMHCVFSKSWIVTITVKEECDSMHR